MMPDPRPFARPGDLEIILDHVRQRPADRLARYPNLVDLRELLAVPGSEARAWLWERSRIFLGFALLNSFGGERHLHLEPAVSEGQAPVAEMLAWAVRKVSAEAECEESALELVVGDRVGIPGFRTLLAANGFRRRREHTLHFSRPLGEPILPPALPGGYRIRPARGSKDSEDWVALHRAAFGTEMMTLSDRRAMMEAPHYDGQLDLVAEAPDGRLAAYCLCTISDEENALTGRRDAYTDPVATHPAHRRKGLARALLRRGLGLLRERDMEFARLGTSSANLPMQALARDVGFRVTGQTHFFVRSIHP